MTLGTVTSLRMMQDSLAETLYQAVTYGRRSGWQAPGGRHLATLLKIDPEAAYKRLQRLREIGFPYFRTAEAGVVIVDDENTATEKSTALVFLYLYAAQGEEDSVDREAFIQKAARALGLPAAEVGTKLDRGSKAKVDYVSPLLGSNRLRPGRRTVFELPYLCRLVRRERPEGKLPDVILELIELVEGQTAQSMIP